MGTKLLIASNYLDPVNHVVVRNSDNTFTAYCGSGFKVSDGYLDDQDSVQFARLCEKCLDKMTVLKLPVPSRSIPGWRESPSL